MGVKLIIFSIVTVFLLGTGGYFYMANDEGSNIVYEKNSENTVTKEGSGKKDDMPVPVRKILEGGTHVWQTFNNCSSVALVIALSYFGVTDTQEAIAEATRPWNNRNGDNDDKSVTLFELEKYVNKKYYLSTYVRANGDIELLKKFIANDIPILTRARMYPDKDFVHYRVIRGYDDSEKIVIESDGIEGNEVKYSYDKWMHLWEKFNYSYLIVVPPSKGALVDKILGEEKDEKIAWQNAKSRAEERLSKNEADLVAHYNLITAMYYLGDYKGTVREFEKVESRISENMLWYQPEPIFAYFNLKEYDRVIELADSVINNNNKSVSELYILKGEIYKLRGNLDLAKAEFEKAVFYNKSLKEAKDALASVK